MHSDDLMKEILQEFHLSPQCIHGVSHWARVRDIGLRLAEQTGANPEIVEMFAYLHDSKRRTDGLDPGHGKRAAEFARTLRNSCVKLSDHDFELLALACEGHTDGLMEGDVTVLTCWDSDRLDLGRVGIRPEPSRLCTEAARDPGIIEWAWKRSREETRALRRFHTRTSRIDQWPGK